MKLKVKDLKIEEVKDQDGKLAVMVTHKASGKSVTVSTGKTKAESKKIAIEMLATILIYKI